MGGSQFPLKGDSGHLEIFFKLPGHSNVHPALRTTILGDRDLQESFNTLREATKETGDI